MDRDKTCIVIQGNVRKSTYKCIKEFQRNGYYVIFSCWQDCIVPAEWHNEKLKIIKTTKPSKRGLNNRNLLRVSANRGVKEAKRKGFQYIIKWRSDIIPGDNFLKNLENEKFITPIEKGKIIIPNFRCFKFTPRLYSSINDMVQIGRSSAMDILWGLDMMDMDKEYNGPKQIKDWPVQMIESFYCNESELLANIIARKLQAKVDDLYDIDEQLYDDTFDKTFELSSYQDFDMIWLNEKLRKRSLITTVDRGCRTNIEYMARVAMIEYKKLNWMDKLRLKIRN